MSRDSGGAICLGELRAIIDGLRPQFLFTNLPNDFSSELPSEIDITGDMRKFVQQLRLFNAPDSVIKQAIISYYRAYGQRNRWSKEGLLNPGELGSYDQRIYDEWEHRKSMIELELDISSPSEEQAFAKKLYTQCQDVGAVNIRRDFREPFVSRGSYQILSDEMRLGWHPNYFNMLEAQNDGVA
ncbi:MAG: ABC-three component system protein [Sulfitobacter sp.]